MSYLQLLNPLLFSTRFRIFGMSVVWLLLLSNNLCLQAQPQVDKQGIMETYADEDAVFLNKTEHLGIVYENEEWNIERTVSEDIFYLGNASQVYGQKMIYYTSFEEIEQIEAKTYVPYQKGKKTRYEVFPVNAKNIETKDVLSGGIFYSDHKQKKVSFPAVQKGAITSISYTEVTNEPRLLSGFYFSSYAPVLNSSFSVTVPDNVSITHKVMGENTDQVNFEKKQLEGATIYQWTVKNVAKLERESNAPSSSYYEPHVVIYINEGTENGNKNTVLGNVDNLYDWYWSLVEEVNTEEDEQLKKVVAELTQGVRDDLEKTKRIFQWVQDNIKYVAFEDGLGGFVPREAKDVCQKKYGDCKDMASIITTMLKMADVSAYLTWIGTRDRPYSYYDVPSPIADNHMIAAIKHKGEFMFLDATGDFIPFGYPTSMIQGKEALVGIDADNYEVVKVPVIEKEHNTVTETIDLIVKDRDLIGTANRKVTGYVKVFTEYGKMRADAEENQQYFDEYLRKGTNKFTITDVNATGYFDRNKDINVDYSFVIPGYITKAGGSLYANMNLLKRFKNGKIDLEERKVDREAEYKYIETFNISLTIPDGHVLDYLPPNATYKKDEFGFDINYVQEGNVIRLNTKYYSDFLILSKEKFPEWNEMIAVLTEAYQEVVVLKEK
ncbi:MAG: DUF3857 domain-containing transglutaminase family protein [Chitinophagales bacterium]